MKIKNISNVKDFFAVVDKCVGRVELVSNEGDRINLKSKLAQYLSIGTVFSNGYVRELELVVSDPKDMKLFMNYMMKQNRLSA